MSKKNETKTPLIETKTTEKVPNNAYIVQKGDKLSSIATKHGLSVRKLMEMNKLESFPVEVGKQLVIK